MSSLCSIGRVSALMLYIRLLDVEIRNANVESMQSQLSCDAVPRLQLSLPRGELASKQVAEPNPGIDAPADRRHDRNETSCFFTSRTERGWQSRSMPPSLNP